jgi:CheY-like chemotaxis protein
MENVNLTGKKILIVEDDFASRLYLNKILEKTGATLFTAEDGKTAVDIFMSNTDIELILMDIQLPVMNGYEATLKIRERSKGVIIIAQTAYGLHGDREKIIASGFNDCLVKPFIHHNLIELIVSKLSGAVKNS